MRNLSILDEAQFLSAFVIRIGVQPFYFAMRLLVLQCTRLKSAQWHACFSILLDYNHFQASMPGQNRNALLSASFSHCLGVNQT